MSEATFHVGVELGGTKAIVAASTGGRYLSAKRRIPTTAPEPTLAAIREAISEVSDGHVPHSLGIASFGPIDLRPSSRTFGELISTPKAGWSGTNVISSLSLRPEVAVNLDTDVNAAVLGERVWGAATSGNVAYVTVGTGIGGAIWSNGAIVRGANHSEIGHLRVPRHPDDSYTGSCRYHNDCLEGMASGTALEERWGKPAESLGDDMAPAVTIEAWYLAHGVASMSAVVPVSQVIVGGGVSKMPGLHEAVSAALPGVSNRYPPVPFAEGGPEILAPGLGDDSGVVGAIELARLL